MTVELLIEDYKRRLTTATLKISDLEKDGTDDAMYNRLITKSSCYRTFIHELELIQKEKNQSNV